MIFNVLKVNNLNIIFVYLQMITQCNHFFCYDSRTDKKRG